MTWKCNNCQTLNIESSDLCESCGSHKAIYMGEILFPENIDILTIKEVFDSAYIDSRIAASHNGLAIESGIGVVLIRLETNSDFKSLSYHFFHGIPSAIRESRAQIYYVIHQLVSQERFASINLHEEFEQPMLKISYDMILNGGVSANSIGTTYQRFCEEIKQITSII